MGESIEPTGEVKRRKEETRPQESRQAAECSCCINNSSPVKSSSAGGCSQAARDCSSLSRESSGSVPSAKPPVAGPFQQAFNSAVKTTLANQGSASAPQSAAPMAQNAAALPQGMNTDASQAMGQQMQQMMMQSMMQMSQMMTQMMQMMMTMVSQQMSRLNGGASGNGGKNVAPDNNRNNDGGNNKVPDNNRNNDGGKVDGNFTKDSLKPHGGWQGTEGPVQDLVGMLGKGFSVSSAKRDKQMTASGNTSDHWVGNKNAYANDIVWGSSSPTASSDQAASKIVQALGGPADWGSHGGVFNKTINGVRYQVIYRSNVGGNHFNHIHLGARRT